MAGNPQLSAREVRRRILAGDATLEYLWDEADPDYDTASIKWHTFAKWCEALRARLAG
jgi:hypothetical protein